MCKQVSRLGFILIGQLPANMAVVKTSFRQLHGYWASSEIASEFPRHFCRRNAQIHTLFNFECILSPQGRCVNNLYYNESATKQKLPYCPRQLFGTPSGTRTLDTLIKSQVL